MRVDGHDEIVLAGLAPRAVASWLRMRGFQSRGAYGDYGALFGRQDEDGEHEVLLPTSPDVRDFTRRMAELVTDLIEIEKRSPSDILTDLTLAPFDVIKIRSPDADSYGSVRLSAGVDLHEEASNIIVAAANAAASPSPRKSWRGRRPDEVNSYIESVRLGQTQRGSFIVTLLSPWDFTSASNPTLDLGGTTFGRLVTKSLARALNATELALRKSVAEGVQPLVEAYRSGVSSNLCMALAKLAREGDGIDLSVAWSPVNPEDKPVFLSLKRQDASILTEAAKALATQEPETNTTLQGLLAGIIEDPERFDGSAILEASISGSLRRVKVKFSESERDKIYNAAVNKEWVQVVGELTREGTRLQLNNPRNIKIIHFDEFEEAEEV